MFEKSKWYGITSRHSGLISICTFAVLGMSGCGGGGGGGGGVGGGGGGGDGNVPTLVYAGNTNAAVVTTGNAAKLTADVMGSGDAPAIIVGVSVASSDAAQRPSSGLTDVARRLNRSLRGTVLQPGRPSAAQQFAAAANPVDSTDLCDSGSVRTFGTLNDDGTGTLTVSFNDCRSGNDTLSGQATLRVDSFDLSNFVPTDSTFSFSRLLLRGPGVNVDVGGSLRSQLNIGTNTETLTENVVALDNNTGQITKAENLVFVNVYISILFPSSYTETITGRVFDSVHGFVDITTIFPLVFDTTNLFFPDSGRFLLMGAPMGAGNRSVLVTALSSTMVRLALDLDGDGVRENTATLKWTDLSGPVGADLADSDGDGMHNSWETANGLNPNIADAALDNDVDGASNLIEYLAGTGPNNANSIPEVSITTVSAGGEHTCGLTVGGTAYCWGLGSNGQIGNGGTASSSIPVPVSGGLAFKSISAGGGAFVGHTCGVTTSGAAYCWGYGGWGQLGNGTENGSPVPVPVSGGLTFALVSAGRVHTCGITTGGAAYCWGKGGEAQLGDGTTTNNNSTTPVPVSGGLSFASVSAGVFHSCGVAASGIAYCWGNGDWGKLGNGGTASSSTPVPVSGGLTFMSVSAALYHSCGVTTSGAAYCWGRNNLNGQLGNGTFVDSSLPVPVSGGQTFNSLSARELHTCGVAVSGAAFCWGNNDRGQLGILTGMSSSTPAQVFGVIAFSVVSPGESHTCGNSANDRVYCWGWNLNGQLGTGTAGDSFAPVRISPPM